MVHIDHMNHLQGLQSHTLQDHKFFVRFVVLDQRNKVAPPFSLQMDLIREALLAEFTGESFPEVGLHKIIHLELLFAFDPASEAVEVDVLHGAGAVAGGDEFVLVGVFFAQTDPTDRNPIIVELLQRLLIRLNYIFHGVLAVFFFVGAVVAEFVVGVHVVHLVQLQQVVLHHLLHLLLLDPQLQLIFELLVGVLVESVFVELVLELSGPGGVFQALFIARVVIRRLLTVKVLVRLPLYRRLEML
mmetsp:Transcript_3582/g.3517  ORF Transcript_3582/g.3517 Transcript_3582/m.3517 type:complete len:244 (-) Transcript_3582:427-1158(-)